MLAESSSKRGKKYKNTTKSEADLVKSLQLESGITELEIDLLGQMINRQELNMTPEVFASIRQQRNLTTLKLTLSSTTIADLTELAKALTGLSELLSLTLSLGNTKVCRVNELGMALGTLKQLEVFELSLWATNVSEISDIGKGIGCMKMLTVLEMQLGYVLS